LACEESRKAAWVIQLHRKAKVEGSSTIECPRGGKEKVAGTKISHKRKNPRTPKMRGIPRGKTKGFREDRGGFVSAKKSKGRKRAQSKRRGY